MSMATSACRGFVSAGRRCRTPASVVWPLVQRGLDASSSKQALAPSSARGYARTSMAFAAAPSIEAEGSTAWSLRRPGTSLSGRGQASMVFSTSAGADADADAAGDDSGAPAAAAGVDKEEGPKEGEGEGASTAPEENPLEGMVPDDGDPGPPPPLDPSIVTEPSPKVLEVMAAIDDLNFVEMAMLIDVFKNKLGLEEVPTLSYGGDGGGDGDSGGGGGGDAPAAAGEKTVFKVKVTGFGDKAKIKVIKEVRGVTGLGLREAKEMVENLPQVVKEDLKQEEAEELKGKLEAAGATVELE